MKKQIFVKLRATDDERNEWNALAKSQGMPLAQLIRKLLATVKT